MSWQKPAGINCEKCGSFMVEKGNKIVCSNTQCGHVIEKVKKIMNSANEVQKKD